MNHLIPKKAKLPGKAWGSDTQDNISALMLGLEFLVSSEPSQVAQ